jgi:hypothetical protein
MRSQLLCVGGDSVRFSVELLPFKNIRSCVFEFPGFVFGLLHISIVFATSIAASLHQDRHQSHSRGSEKILAPLSRIKFGRS